MQLLLLYGGDLQYRPHTQLAVVPVVGLPLYLSLDSSLYKFRHTPMRATAVHTYERGGDWTRSPAVTSNFGNRKPQAGCNGEQLTSIVRLAGGAQGSKAVDYSSK